MNQAQLFEPTKPEARSGYSPASKINYRGHLIPASYRETVGMRIESWPTLVWLLEDIMEALSDGHALRWEVHDRLPRGIQASVISKHMALLEELGMIKVMHRYGMTPGQDVVQLLEV